MPILFFTFCDDLGSCLFYVRLDMFGPEWSSQFVFFFRSKSTLDVLWLFSSRMKPFRWSEIADSSLLPGCFDRFVPEWVSCPDSSLLSGCSVSCKCSQCCHSRFPPHNARDPAVNQPSNHQAFSKRHICFRNIELIENSMWVGQVSYILECYFDIWLAFILEALLAEICLLYFFIHF